ncbi:glycosyltransferase family 9 protein [uncultured Nitrospira sp.]|uniref:glycosyltransferase family 9 protein n=1 Tax=uncultured Nitrospira sp. TaxID=157176 RepID=UPI00314053F7
MPLSLPNLLIVHPGALGDGLLALPALRVLQITFPGHRLIWFGHKELGDVLVDTQEVHQSFSFDRLEFLAYRGKNDSYQEKFLSIIRDCDKAICWFEDKDGVWRSWLKNAGIQNCIFRSPHDPTLLHKHMVDRYVEILQPWARTTQVPCDIEKNVSLTRHLVFPKSLSLRVSSPNKEPLIVLHAGSGSRYKCASPVLLASIVNGLMIANPKRKICLIGGPADIDSLRNVQRLLTHPEYAILTGMDLLQVAQYLQHAQLFIGHDSGLSHFAASLGISSVLLFGPTDPAKWAPRGTHVTVLRKFCYCIGKVSVAHCTDKQCLSIPQHEVLAKVEEVLCSVKASVSYQTVERVDEDFTVPCLG